MASGGKILTVSYGTFSCTLEGFDDSFGTMKAIAEYFRDLAAEDRFFGAEPPTPDAELLQRIAEREIRKWGEARVGEDGIALRPAGLTSSGMGPVFAEQAPRTAAAPTPAGAVDRGPDETDSVAAKLARIRAVVERARAAAPAEPVIPNPCQAPAPDPSPPDPAPRGEGPPDPKSPDPSAEAPDLPPARSAAEARAGIGEATVAGAVVGTWTPKAPPPAPGTAESAAAISETLAAPAASMSINVAGADALTAGGAQAATASSAAAGDPTEPVPATLRTQVADANGPRAEPAQEPAQAGAAPRARARVLKLRRADLAAHWPGAAPAARPEPKAARLPDALEAESQAELATLRTAFGQPSTAGTDRAAEADAPFATIDARTAPEEDAVTVRPATAAVALNDADDGGPEDAPATQAADATCAAAPDHGSGAAAHAQPRAGPGNADAPAPPETRTAVRPPLPEPERVEIALQRLWDETNTRLDEAAHKRRSMSIAHLKAAVAAVMADRKAGRAGRPGTEDEIARRPYREVLAKVVRGSRDRPLPARPTGGTRLAPLILVAEQRIDIDRPALQASQDALRPRRVMADAGSDQAGADMANPGAADTAFGTFVAARGATGIAEVLVAAAAYVQTVEGTESFTRARVLGLTMEHLGADTTREEVLRAFASLVGTGAFRKVRARKFVLTGAETRDTTRRDERRHA